MADKQSREVDFIVDEKGTAVDLRKSPRNLSLKVDLDISEALTGLKAIQREAKKAAQALRELEVAQSTKSLHEALVQREGVDEYFVNAHGGFAKISVDNGDTGETITIEGPALIVVNRD